MATFYEFTEGLILNIDSVDGVLKNPDGTCTIYAGGKDFIVNMPHDLVSHILKVPVVAHLVHSAIPPQDMEAQFKSL